MVEVNKVLNRSRGISGIFDSVNPMVIGGICMVFYMLYKQKQGPSGGRGGMGGMDGMGGEPSLAACC